MTHTNGNVRIALKLKSTSWTVVCHCFRERGDAQSAPSESRLSYADGIFKMTVSLSVMQT